MERADVVKFFIKKAVREGVIDEDIAEELNNFGALVMYWEYYL